LFTHDIFSALSTFSGQSVLLNVHTNTAAKYCRNSIAYLWAGVAEICYLAFSNYYRISC